MGTGQLLLDDNSRCHILILWGLIDSFKRMVVGMGVPCTMDDFHIEHSIFHLISFVGIDSVESKKKESI